MCEIRIHGIDWTRASFDGEDIIIPIPEEGVTLGVDHNSSESAPGIAEPLQKTKPYKLLGQKKGVQLR